MTDPYARARALAGMIRPPTGPAPGGLALRQAVVADVEMGSVALFFSDAAYPVGGLNFLESYNPKIGDTVWAIKNGPDYLILGPTVLPGGNEEEPWHYVGAIEYGEPAWANGWQNYGSDAFFTYDSAAFFKDPDGFVHLKGVVENLTAAAYDSVIFILPEGYRPDGPVRVPVAASSGGIPARLWTVEINPNGEVRLTLASNGSATLKEYVSLSGIRFMAAEDTPHERQHEWTPFGRFGAWNWDAAANDITPPGQWHRWDGLVRCRGRWSTGTSSSIALISERSGKRRWNLLFPTLYVDGLVQLQGVRVDITPYIRTLERVGGATMNDITIDGLQWFADIPESYWTEIDLLNSWVGFDNQDWANNARYYKDGYGHVHVNGLIKNGVTTIGTVIGTLPPDCRPEANLIFASWAADGSTRIDVGSNGDIILMDSTVNNGHLSLDSISFRANPNYTL